MTLSSRSSSADTIPAMRAFTGIAVGADAEGAQEDQNETLYEEVTRLRELVCHLLLKNEWLLQGLADQAQMNDRANPYFAP